MKTLRRVAMAAVLTVGTLGTAAEAASAAPATSRLECTAKLPVGPQLCVQVFGTGLYIEDVYVTVSAAPGNPWVGRVWAQFRPYAVKGGRYATVLRQSRSGHASFEECIIFTQYIGVGVTLPRAGRWRVGVWSAPGYPETMQTLEGTIHQ